MSKFLFVLSVKLIKNTIILIVFFILLSFLIYTLNDPSNTKNWSLGNTKTASIVIDSNHVVINNFRDVDWQKTELSAFDNNYYKKLEFQLDDIQSLHAVVSHFAVLSEIAHIFIFFELKDKTMIGLSVEARKEQGEEYSLSGGLSAKFELIYLMASYRDLVGLRLNRDEKVFSYPIKASAADAQALFKVAAARVNKINNTAEFYHLFIKNCTTEIVSLVNQISNEKFPRLTQSFFPGDAGKALYDMGLIYSTTASFKEIQASSLINK